MRKSSFRSPHRKRRRRRTGLLGIGVAVAALALLAAPAAYAASTTTVEGWGASEVLGIDGTGNAAPTPLTEVPDATAAAVGRASSYYLTPRGVFATRSNMEPFTYLLPNTAGATAVATGGTTESIQEATLILQPDGAVLGFGNNTYGSAGAPPGQQVLAPTPIAGLEHVTAVACGTIVSAALKADGTVWAWGFGTDLGSPTLTANTGTPQQVQLPTGAGQKAVAIAIGGGQSLALLEDGSVWAWGNNANGQVGNGSTTTPVTTPAEVIAPPAPGAAHVTQIAAGQASSYALYSDGTFQAWGSDESGQLGLGSGSSAEVLTPTAPEPAAVAAHPNRYPELAEITGVYETAFAIVAGNDNGAARRVLVWGDNSKGLLGFGAGTPRFDYAWPYDPANPNTAGTSTQGATEIPQFLGKLKGVPWLGIGGNGYVEVAPTEPTFRLLQTEGEQLAFFSHPVGTVSGSESVSFISNGDASTVTGMDITGADAEDFTIVRHNDSGTNRNEAPFPITLPAAGTFTAWVQFHPTGFGERFATLTVTTASESASILLDGFGSEFPGNTPGPQGAAGTPGLAGKDGSTGGAGPAGPAGKNGVVVFAATRSKVSAVRGKAARLSFLVVNGTTASVTGASVSAKVPKSLGATGSGPVTRVAALPAGSTRRLAIPLRIGRGAKLGAHSVRVSLNVGARTVTRTVNVRVFG